MYRANHAQNVEFIGFSIKGIRYILEKIEFPEAKKGPYILAEIIDVMIKSQSRGFERFYTNVFSEYARA